MTRDREVVLIGRCKACERARKAAGESRPLVAKRWTGVRTDAVLGPDRFGNQRFDLLRLTPSAIVCECGASIYGRVIVGRVVPEIPCGAKCQNATGHDCDCSCGGANHGAAHGKAA